MFIRPIMPIGSYSGQISTSNNSRNTHYITRPILNDSLSFSANLMNRTPKKAYELISNIISAGKSDDTIGVFKACGIDVKVNPDDTLTISHYAQPLENIITFKDLGIDEQELFKNVKIVQGIANFNLSQIKHADNLVEAGGIVASENSMLESLNSLLKVHKDLELGFNKKIKYLDSVQEIGGNLDLEMSNVLTMNGLKRVGGDIMSYGAHIQEMDNLAEVGGVGKLAVPKARLNFITKTEFL